MKTLLGAMVMVLRYKGHFLKINKERWRKQTFKEKLKFIKEYFSEEIKYIIEGVKDYWIGYVEVQIQDILCGGYGTDEPSHNEIYEVSIFCGRFNSGQWFSNIGKDIVERIVNDWEVSDKKRFHLHLDLGCGMSQQYIFSKKQKEDLVKKLKPLLNTKWYWDDGDDE